ncbi:MAG: hypothetical protein QNJ46_05975 [Leptolyngbyaceae cyanobacterium MO_188.B28]|nr:hypothetical protein [Leptolyngbyaceae cyanobacterium MO_188.B28]
MNQLTFLDHRNPHLTHSPALGRFLGRSLSECNAILSPLGFPPIKYCYTGKGRDMYDASMVGDQGQTHSLALFTREGCDVVVSAKDWGFCAGILEAMT